MDLDVIRMDLSGQTTVMFLSGIHGSSHGSEVVERVLDLISII